MKGFALSNIYNKFTSQIGICKKNKTKDNQIKDVGPKRILASRQRVSHKRTD